MFLFIDLNSTSLSSQTISQMIQMSNYLKSLSAASSVLSSSLDLVVTSSSSNVFPSVNSTLSAAPAPAPFENVDQHQQETHHSIEPEFIAQQQNQTIISNNPIEERELILDDVSIDEIIPDP